MLFSIHVLGFRRITRGVLNSTMNYWDERKRNKAVKEIFDSVLGSKNPKDVWIGPKLAFSDSGTIYEFTANGNQLSEAVFNVDFPRLDGPVELDHYTTITGLKGIIDSSSLHLSSLLKRYDQDEFTTYVKKHDLLGYSKPKLNENPLQDQLVKDLFFCSITCPSNPDPTPLWDEFANKGKGIRIRLRLTPTSAVDLRHLGYHQNGRDTALKQINDKLKTLNLTYTPWGISRICAFFLPLGYQDEREVRLLIKSHEGGPDPTIGEGVDRVWPVSVVPSGQPSNDNFCKIELVSVLPGPKCNEQMLQNILDGTAFSSTPILNK